MVSDSTLHQFFASPDVTQTCRGDSTHIDYLTIDSADIRTLIDAFKLKYIYFPPKPKPMDIVLVTGYKNLLTGHPGEHIIQE